MGISRENGIRVIFFAKVWFQNVHLCLHQSRRFPQICTQFTPTSYNGRSTFDFVSLPQTSRPDSLEIVKLYAPLQLNQCNVVLKCRSVVRFMSNELFDCDVEWAWSLFLNWTNSDDSFDVSLKIENIRFSCRDFVAQLTLPEDYNVLQLVQTFHW